MLIFFILGAGLLLGVAQSAGQGNTTVVLCNSFSCFYNRRARCTRRQIAVYDNIAIGLCLYHTETMSKRILEPEGKGVVVETGKPNPQMINKIMKAQEKKKNSELLKNPRAFAKWLKDKGVKF